MLLSIIMPCLNEEETIAICMKEAKALMKSHHIQGEILLVDNGSTDHSAEIAQSYGARVLKEPVRGYGKALRTGIKNSRGKVIIMGDSDATYDFRHLEKFFYPLHQGKYDVMIGNRFAGKMEKGAMPFSHRIGVPVLSMLGRWRWHTDVRDFHCGLRGMTRKAARTMRLRTRGMEFATEMIAEAARHHMRMGQVPVTLRKCPVERKPKLRTYSDGLRHLMYLLR